MTPAVLLPVRGLRDLTKESRTAYEDFHPGANLTVTGGSASLLGELISDSTGQNIEERPWLRPTCCLKDLAKFRCRTVVLLTDYLASGHQVENYARAFVRNPSIRSWRSFKLIRIVVVACAASLDGVSFLQHLRFPRKGRHFPIVQLEVERIKICHMLKGSFQHSTK